MKLKIAIIVLLVIAMLVGVSLVALGAGAGTSVTGEKWLAIQFHSRVEAAPEVTNGSGPLQYIPGDEVTEMRTQNSKTLWLGGDSYSWDGTIGSIHYEDDGWQEIDNIFEPALAPWDWEMLDAGYHVRVVEDFTAGQIIEFENQGETLQFQPMALEWTNDLDQIQPVAMPHEVTPIITNPEVDLLPAVGVLSHQGTIRWNDAYGEGIDFEWKATSTRLAKVLEIENLDKLPTPEQFILDGGNPALRLNLIFDPPTKQDVDIVVDGEIWSRNSEVQTFNIIEFVKDGEVLWGFMPLRYWGSGEDEDSEGQSIATLEKRGNKLYISIRVPYDWLQGATYPVFIDADVEEQIGHGDDDSTCSSGSNYPAWSYIRLSYDYARGGFRWSIDIPDGSIITKAFYSWRCHSTKVGHSTVFRGQVFDEDSCTDFSGGTFWARAVMPEYVDFTVVGGVVGGTWYGGEGQTFETDIKTLVQAFIDRDGYSPDNYIGLRMFYQSGTASSSFYATSFDNNPNYGANLHIEYEGAGCTEDISNTPSTWSVNGGTPVATSTDYWSSGSEPNWPLDDGECHFTVTNNSGGAVDITVKATNFTGGNGWTLTSDSPGADTVRLRAGQSGDANEGAMVILTTSFQAFIDDLPDSADIKWELEMETPSSYTDGVEKASTITISATCS